MSEEKVITIDGQEVKIGGDVESVRVTLNRTVKDPPEVRVKLSKMSKGYQWEISADGPDPKAVLSLIENTDHELTEKYATLDE